MFTFIETRMFARLADEYLGDDGLRALQEYLLLNPVMLSRGRVVCARCAGVCRVVARVVGFG